MFTFLSGRKLSSSSHLHGRHFSFSLNTLVPFKLLPWCWSSEGGSLGKSVCEFFKRNCWDSRNFFYRLNPHCFLQPDIMGIYLLVTGTLCWMSWCGAGMLCSQDNSINFLIYHLWMWGQSVQCLHPSYQSGWMWFL